MTCLWYRTSGLFYEIMMLFFHNFFHVTSGNFQKLKFFSFKLSFGFFLGWSPGTARIMGIIWQINMINFFFLGICLMYRGSRKTWLCSALINEFGVLLLHDFSVPLHILWIIRARYLFFLLYSKKWDFFHKDH